MKLTKKFTIKHFNRIKHIFPVQRGYIKYSNYQVMKAMLYALENGGKWRQLPKSYGNWNALYRRVNKLGKTRLLADTFEYLYREKITSADIDVLCLDSTIVKVHPNACGANQWSLNMQRAHVQQEKAKGSR